MFRPSRPSSGPSRTQIQAFYSVSALWDPKCLQVSIHHHHHQYSALEAGLAATRAQSCDRYGSGTLHPGQALGGSLPLLYPAFRRSHFRRQAPVRPQRHERSWQRKVDMWARNFSVILPKFRLPRKFRDLLHAANLGHGTDGFTSPPKEGVLRIFSP